MVLFRWICDSLNPVLTQSTEWRVCHFVTTSCRYSNEVFLPAEGCLTRPRNRISKRQGKLLLFLYLLLFFCPFYLLLSLLPSSGACPLCSCAVRMVLQEWDCSAHSGLLVCSHTEGPFSSSSHPAKSHTQMTRRGRGCLWHDLWVAADPTNSTSHEAPAPGKHAHLPLMGTKDALWASPSTYQAHHLFIWFFTSLSVQHLSVYFPDTQMMDCDILLRCLYQPVPFPQAELPLSFGNCKCHVAVHCYGKL